MFHRRMTTRVRALTATATVAAALCALSGCTSETRAEAPDDRPSVIAPGRPGEAAETMSAEKAEQAVGDDTPNSADFDYVQMMIEHHRQALVMTDIAAEHAGSSKVERLAERIAASQGPEIKAMEGWLDQHGRPREDTGHSEHSGRTGPSGHAGHGQAAMPGMATEKQLADLRAARGSAFDQLFLKLMITHHQGALSMATDVLSEGNNVLVEEMANDVVAQQTSEIGRMRDMA